MNISREEPFFRKCCFCIPLKSCLQTWSVIKSMADISIAAFFILMIVILTNHFYRGVSFHEFTFVHTLFILTVVLLIDSVFMVVLSVGLFTNNLRSLRVFYFYSIYMVVMGASFVLGASIYGALVIKKAYYDNVLYAIFVVCGIFNSVLDVCIILTLKSEMIKLRNKQQYEFIKMPSLTEEGGASEPAEPFQVDEENAYM